MFERFDPDSRQVVVKARAQAKRLEQSPAGTHHLLLALLEVPGPVAQSLEVRGLTPAVVEAGVASLLDRSPPSAQDDRQALGVLGIDLDQVRASAESTFGPGALERASARRELRWLDRVAAGIGRGHRQSLVDQLRSPFTPRTKKVLELALREAIRLKSSSITPTHLGLGLLREGEGLGCAILAHQGLSFDDLRRAWEAPHSSSAA